MASTPEGGTRKLAAIMFTDVKDFSKKMSENEIAAMELLKVHDTMVRDTVAKYGGIVIKSLGDSFMVDFSSAVNAVRCAIEAQEQFWHYNQGKSEFDKIQIRVGIHLGDVITVGNDIYGDGVNIAARIEAITEPTRICVSADIYNQVKNKMPIRAYSIGSIDLKNIAEPVEVLELLIDSIPEFSEPSESAKQVPTRRKAELLSSQEEEEANRVEAAKRKVDEEQQKEDAERQERANAHFLQAEEYFRAGDLDKAEEEIKEIYKIVQIHYEAQMLVLQIEEQRARNEENQRRERVKEEKRRKEEERQQRIQEHIDNALAYVELDQYTEALYALQEVYSIDPNNEQAKQLEEQIRFAEEERLELMRLEAIAEADHAREELLNQQDEISDELRLAESALEEAYPVEQPKPERNKKLYIGIGAGFVVVLGIIVTLLLTRNPLKKPTAIAVLPFTASQTDESYLGEAISSFMTDEIARVPDITAIAPVSAQRLGADSSGPHSAAVSLGISHIVRGSVSISGTTVTLKTQLIEIKENKTLWESSLQSHILDVSSLASRVCSGFFRFLEIDFGQRNARHTTNNVDAYVLYLRGTASMMQPTAEGINQGISFFQQAVDQDSSFTAAKAALSDALLEQFKRQGERDKSILALATNLAYEAISSPPPSAQAHLVLGESYRYGQQFAQAREEIDRSLAIQPGNPECSRELALLSLIEGNADEATQHAASALKIDPKHYDSHLVKGIVDLSREQYEDADRLFQEASGTRCAGFSPDRPVQISNVEGVE